VVIFHLPSCGGCARYLKWRGGKAGGRLSLFNRRSLGKSFFRTMRAQRHRPSIVPVTRHGISHRQDHHLAMVPGDTRRNSGLTRCRCWRLLDQFRARSKRPLRLRHVPTYLPRASCFLERLVRTQPALFEHGRIDVSPFDLERRFSVPACNLTARRDAEAGSPSKTVTATPSVTMSCPRRDQIRDPSPSSSLCGPSDRITSYPVGP